MKIEIIVSPKGETRMETKGFAGSSCRDASRFIEQALGQRSGEQLTAEFHSDLAVSGNQLHFLVRSRRVRSQAACQNCRRRERKYQVRQSFHEISSKVPDVVDGKWRRRSFLRILQSVPNF